MLHVDLFLKIRHRGLVPNLMIWQQIVNDFGGRFPALRRGYGTAQDDCFVLDLDGDVELTDPWIPGQRVTDMFGQIGIEILRSVSQWAPPIIALPHGALCAAKQGPCQAEYVRERASEMAKVAKVLKVLKALRMLNFPGDESSFRRMFSRSRYPLADRGSRE